MRVRPLPMHPLLRGLATALCILLIAAGLATWRQLPPAPLPADAPPDVFSAYRAFLFLERMVGDGIPHPNGSPQNDIVRERILKAFREMGYAPEVQEAMVDRRGRPFTVRNVMARLPGTFAANGDAARSRLPGSAVLLMSHYDSVPDGPGASDAGVSVAVILEVARMLRNATPQRNDVIFLITDGEEYGLLGALAFVTGHPWVKDTGVVVNLEARGTSGLSLMFETGDRTAWLAGRMVDSLHHPAANSLMAAVYRTMPNNTDLTVFLRAGYTGYNFAFIGDHQHYHTSSDDLAHVDLRSFQHQGENALALVRTLAESDLSSLPEAREAVWFDFQGSFLVWWPLPLTLPLGLLALALSVWLMLRLRRREALSVGGALIGIGQSLLLAGVAFGAAWLFARLARTLGWIVGRNAAAPAAVVSGFWLTALLGTLLAVWLLSRWSRKPRFGGLVWGSSSLWTLLALIATLLFPQGSYLLLVPALVATMTGLVATGIPPNISTLDDTLLRATLLTLFLTACLWLPLEFLFYQALGLAPAWLTAARPALVSVLAAPVLGFRNG